ncbi:MAG: DUF6048 family protein [Cyclobacteriaceae bacterium]|nr:hypothetical protein [Cyclobacteriaceae bacterium]MCH8516643.1 DUF6048 family protein [Cyclobacteriaceae bacterium]
MLPPRESRAFESINFHENLNLVVSDTLPNDTIPVDSIRKPSLIESPSRTLRKVDFSNIDPILKQYLDESYRMPDSVSFEDIMEAEEAAVAATKKNKRSYFDINSNDNIINHLEIGFDYGKLATFLLPFETKAEAFVGLRVLNYFVLVAEGGYSLLTPTRAFTNLVYEAEGYYGRVGIDIFSNYQPKANIWAGFRYGQNLFNERGTISIASELWGDFEESYFRENLEARWIEFVIGSDQEFLPNIFVGFNFRYRIMLNYPRFADPVDVFSIPGYGRSIDARIPALNLIVKYKIPFGKPYQRNF